MHYLGIDVGKKESYVAHYENNEMVNEFVLHYDYNSLTRFSYYVHGLKTKLIVFEATGVYSTLIKDFCQKNNFDYARLNPLEAKMHIKTLRRLKNDRVDAHHLALIGPDLKDEKINNALSGLEQERQTYSRMITHLDEDINQLKTRLREKVFYVSPQFEELYQHDLEIPQIKLTFLFPHPECILEHDKSTIKDLIKQHIKYNENTLNKITERVIRIAQSTYILNSKDDPIVEEIKDICDSLITLIERKKKYSTKLKVLCEGDKLYEVILSVPGTGEQLAALLTGELGNLDRFKTNKKLNAFVGIDVAHYQSGNNEKKDFINRRGNRHCRKILYEIVSLFLLNQHRHENHICDYYYKQKNPPYNKHHKVAIGACMNQFLEVIHFLYKHNLRYDYNLATAQ